MKTIRIKVKTEEELLLAAHQRSQADSLQGKIMNNQCGIKIKTSILLSLWAKSEKAWAFKICKISTGWEQIYCQMVR